MGDIRNEGRNEGKEWSGRVFSLSSFFFLLLVVTLFAFLVIWTTPSSLKSNLSFPNCCHNLFKDDSDKNPRIAGHLKEGEGSLKKSLPSLVQSCPVKVLPLLSSWESFRPHSHPDLYRISNFKLQGYWETGMWVTGTSFHLKSLPSLIMLSDFLQNL